MRCLEHPGAELMFLTAWAQEIQKKLISIKISPSPSWNQESDLHEWSGLEVRKKHGWRDMTVRVTKEQWSASLPLPISEGPSPTQADRLRAVVEIQALSRCSDRAAASLGGCWERHTPGFTAP